VGFPLAVQQAAQRIFERHVEHRLRTCSACLCCAGAVALTTNQNYVRDFTVAYDILYENISDQVAHMLVLLSAWV